MAAELIIAPEAVCWERAEIRGKDQSKRSVEGGTMDVATVMKEVGNWPAEERLRLIEEVWDSLSDRPEEIVLSEAHKQDLQRRLDAYRDNPKAGSPWEEVEARLRGKGQ